MSHSRNHFSLCIRGSIRRWSCSEIWCLGEDHGRDCPNRMGPNGVAIWVWHTSEDVRPVIVFFCPCSASQAPKSASAEFIIKSHLDFLWICCLSSQDFLYCLNRKARALFYVCVYNRFLFWILIHLGLEFRAGDGQGCQQCVLAAQRVPPQLDLAQGSCLHGAAVLPAVLMAISCPRSCPAGGAALPAWPPCSTRMICFATFFSCSSPLYGKLLSLSLFLPSYT